MSFLSFFKGVALSIYNGAKHVQKAARYSGQLNLLLFKFMKRI